MSRLLSANGGLTQGCRLIDGGGVWSLRAKFTGPVLLPWDGWGWCCTTPGRECTESRWSDWEERVWKHGEGCRVGSDPTGESRDRCRERDRDRMYRHGDKERGYRGRRKD